MAYFTSPLQALTTTSKDVIKETTEEIAVRDFSKIEVAARLRYERTDEFGVLAEEYYEIVKLMHEVNEEKKSLKSIQKIITTCQ